jgi:hypothetical protein
MRYEVSIKQRGWACEIHGDCKVEKLGLTVKKRSRVQTADESIDGDWRQKTAIRNRYKNRTHANTVTTICLEKRVARPCEAFHSNYILPNTDRFSSQGTVDIVVDCQKTTRSLNVHSTSEPANSQNTAHIDFCHFDASDRMKKIW